VRDGNFAFEKRGGGLHIVLTAPPSLLDMRLADALVIITINRLYGQQSTFNWLQVTR